jgi:anti-sigma factor RsiW
LALEAHLMECSVCRKEFEALLEAVDTVRSARSLYEAPETSRRRVAQLIDGHKRRRRWQLSAAAAVFLVLLFLFGAMVERLTAGDKLAAFAAESHVRYSRGALPLDIHSNEPHAVADWLSSRLPFRLTLPSYPEPPGRAKKYVLEGARLAQLSDIDMAYLAYRMDNRPISLMMTSSSRMVPSGGDVYHSGGLAFHINTYKGLRVITWADRGISYALVSDLAAEGSESCMICHGAETERPKLAPLGPRF